MYPLGINTAHFNVHKLKKLGIGRVEVCLGRTMDRTENQNKIISDMESANILGIPLSVHLPIYLPDSYVGDYLDAFYLNEDNEKRRQSFEMIELNLQKLEKFKVEYYVMHFPGVNEIKEPIESFQIKLMNALDEVNSLAQKYRVKILLEYFGSNINFYKPEEWINKIHPYSNLGLLIDICHLYFASKLRHFDFLNILDLFENHADAYHLWTTKGEGIYSENLNYLKFRHIVPNINQSVTDGWVFDTKTVTEKIMRTHKPIIIEASKLYGDVGYYEESVMSMIQFLTDSNA